MKIILAAMAALGVNAATNLIFPAGMGRIIDAVTSTPHIQDDNDGHDNSGIRASSMLSGLFSQGGSAVGVETNQQLSDQQQQQQQEARDASKKKLRVISGLLLGAFAVGSLAMFTRIALLNVAAERIVARLRKQV
jgi:ABC-type multidrug transport system fused ATPase/permease subunit